MRRGEHGDELHSASERERMLDEMESAANAFYARAVQIGSHSFIEFTGLMNEYIKMCRRAHLEGRDFTRANIHSGVPLIDMRPHEAGYLAEKFGCIFATTFAGNPEAVRVFCDEAFSEA